MTSVATEKETSVVVTKSDDRMTATVSVQPKGVVPDLTPARVVAALEAAAIRITDAVRTRVSEFVGAVESGEVPDAFVIAEGTPPQGRDEQFNWSDKYKSTHDEWQEDAPVDFYTLNSIVTVEKGDVIGNTEPLIPPASGVTVEGNGVPPTCKPETLKLDRTLVRSDEDRSQLVAAISGAVVLESGTIRIEEVLLINGDVSFETGNINSTVDVHVKGRVPDRFEVTSKKSIAVGLTIEASRVSAGRDVTVRNGIAARHTGLVTAGGKITAKYCSDAHLVAGGDIKIARQAMNSQMCTGGMFLGDAASMIGGSLLASGEIRLSQTGSQRNITTRIVTGVKPHIVREAALINRGIERANELVKELGAMLAQLDPAATNVPDGSADVVDEIKRLIGKSNARAASESKRMETLLSDIYIDAEPRVYVSGTVFSGTRVRIADRRVVFHQEQKGPMYIEKRKIENVTELVSVNTLTGSVKTLKNEKRDTKSLLEGFELEECPSTPVPRSA